MNKLPPFGAKFIQLRKSDRYNLSTNFVRIIIGSNCWQRAKIIKNKDSSLLLLPPAATPESFKWPVCQCIVLIVDTGGCNLNYIKFIVKELYKYKPKDIYYISPLMETINFRKDAK